jgi:hypothetical protein
MRLRLRFKYHAPRPKSSHLFSSSPPLNIYHDNTLRTKVLTTFLLYPQLIFCISRYVRSLNSFLITLFKSYIMRYSYVSAAIMAFAPAVFAQVAGFDAISVPAQDQVVKVGDKLDIKWDPNSVAGTVKLQLLEGATPATLQYDPVVIASMFYL